MILRGADRSTRVILSREGTTQGCPLAMFMYAAGVIPLVTKLKDPSRHQQNWFADNSSCGGQLQRVYERFVNLQALGPAYGYFPESFKSIVIVKPGLLSAAPALFEHLQVDVRLCSRFLGGCIGDEARVKAYIEEKVASWTASVARPSAAANSYPHAAYCALTRSLTRGWTYLQRVVSGCDEEYAPLRDARQRYSHQLFLAERSSRENMPFSLSRLSMAGRSSRENMPFSLSRLSMADLPFRIQCQPRLLLSLCPWRPQQLFRMEYRPERTSVSTTTTRSAVKSPMKPAELEMSVHH